MLEELSTSTRTNALRSLDLLQATGREWGHLVVVTNPFHQLRSYWTFRRALRERGLSHVQVQVLRPSKGWGLRLACCRRRHQQTGEAWHCCCCMLLSRLGTTA
jgi:uncharacterized SAM-binding protein YcdF (DUF218 family)